MVLSLPVVQNKFHISLNVSNSERSRNFYRALFGLEPAKLFPDYCKFEVEEPPLILSLVPRPPSSGASLTHVGLSLPDVPAVERVRKRLEAAGIATRTQEETMCGYARQHRCWAADPDGNFWALYAVAEDVDPRSTRQGLEGAEAVLKQSPVRSVWEHFLTHPVPEQVPHADGTVEEVRLLSTFNTVASPQQRDFLLQEAFRVLQPGGSLHVRGLMAERPLADESPSLSGLVVPILHVPSQDGVIDALVRTGFAGVEVVNVSDPPRFVREGVALRDLHLLARKPRALAAGKTVVYKGPFVQAVGDDGTVYPRGRRVEVSAATWDLLRRGLAAECFLFLDAADTVAECSI